MIGRISETNIISDLLSDVPVIRNERALSSYLEQLAKDPIERSFPEYYKNRLDEKGIIKSSAIAASFIDKIYAYQILSGKKNGGREKILSLCIGAGLSLDETQMALTLSKNGVLYSKDPRDSIIIYAICHGLSIPSTNGLLEKYNEAILG